MYDKRMIYINLIVIIFLFFFLPANLKAFEPYSLEANNISYDYRQEKVYASEEVVFISNDIIINADKMVIDIVKTMVIAGGEKVVLKSLERDVSGRHLEYNYSKGSGKFYGASSKVEQLSFKGKVIEITDGEEYQYKINNATFTPCIFAKPHYQLKANSVKIYSGNKIIGEDLSFWWGDTRLFQLPYYVMKYREGANGTELVSSVPLPKVGYNSGQGIIIKMDYPYQLNNSSDGNIFISINQAGDRELKIDNVYNLKKNLTLKSLYNYDKVIEDDKSDINEIYSTVLTYRLNNNYSIRNELKYEKETENSNSEIDRFFAIGLNYNKNKLNIDTLIAYNFSREKRQEELSINYDINDDSNVELYGQYFNEIPEKYSYSYSSLAPVEWEIIYRDGYDLDYSPYFKFDLPEFADIKTGLELGRITSNNITMNKARVDLTFAKAFEPLANFNLNCQQNYSMDLYNGGSEKAQAFTSEIEGRYSHQLNKETKLSGGLSWLKTITGGNYLLEDDKVEEGETVSSLLSLEILTPQPQSAWIINNNNTYNLQADEWEDIDIEVIRKYDCYSLQLNYNFVDKSYGFSINL